MKGEHQQQHQQADRKPTHKLNCAAVQARQRGKREGATSVLQWVGGASAGRIYNAIELRVYSTITTVRFYACPIDGNAQSLRPASFANLCCSFMSNQSRSLHCPRPG